MSRSSWSCPGCRQPHNHPGLCGWCRAAVIELRPGRRLGTDDLLSTVDGLTEKYASPEGLTPRDVDALVTSVHELHTRAARGSLPGDWAYPQPAPRAETVPSGRL